MNYRHLRISRLGLTVVIAATGCFGASLAAAAGSGGGTAGYRGPQNPVFKTLDVLAGGIESVLQRTVLARRTPAGCDALGCDGIGTEDGCDRATLDQLQRHPLEPLPRSGAGYEQIPRPYPSGSAPGVHAEPMIQPPPADRIDAGAQAAPQPAYESNVPQVPRTLPQVPAERQAAPALTGEEGWIESFAPSPPRREPVQRAPVAPQDQYDALPNPFLDDPQDNR